MTDNFQYEVVKIEFLPGYEIRVTSANIKDKTYLLPMQHIKTITDTL